MMNRSNNQRGGRLPGGLESVPVTARRQDDIDGGPANETVRFGLGGADYEIDLSTKNAVAFRKQLAPFLEHARKAGRVQLHRPARSAASRRQRSGDIRARAKDHGIAVSERGRIPASAVEQYQAAAEEPGKTSDRRPARTRRSSRS
jgi:hypothetical protein